MRQWSQTGPLKYFIISDSVVPTDSKQLSQTSGEKHPESSHQLIVRSRCLQRTITHSVLSRRLKQSVLLVGSWIKSGREFQAIGPATASWGCILYFCTLAGKPLWTVSVPWKKNKFDSMFSELVQLSLRIYMTICCQKWLCRLSWDWSECWHETVMRRQLWLT